MRIKCGGLHFFSDFDSGNLYKVELVGAGIKPTQPSLPSICNRVITQNFLPKAFLSVSPSYLYDRDEDDDRVPQTWYLRRDSQATEVPPEPSPALYSASVLSAAEPSLPSGHLLEKVPSLSETNEELAVDCLEFNVWTRMDCQGTAFENGNRTWFYFGVEGGRMDQRIRINIMNLNQQMKLMSQGMAPVYRVLPDSKTWERIPAKPAYKSDGQNFVLSFDHQLPAKPGCQTYFAFTYPFSYTACQQILSYLDDCTPNGLDTDVNGNEDDLYYSRELVCRSLCGRRIDLLTVTSRRGILDEREARLENLFPDSSQPRAHRFKNKKVVFVSSRVHPGETQSSLIFNGFLLFLLSKTDPRAQILRDSYVFKLIPMLNPDGVSLGHYRTNSSGVNLNRFYLTANSDSYPPVYASRSLMMYYHYAYSALCVQKGLDPMRIRDILEVGYCEGIIDKLPSWMSASEKNYTKRGSEANRRSLLFVSQALAKNKISNSQSKPSPAKEDHLSKRDFPLLPSESGLAIFVDLHGHASKRGCFVFGNHFRDVEAKAESMLLSKLMSLNCPHFDFGACNFSQQNMYTKGTKDGLSKEGSARVAIHTLTGIIHSYTLECNFNTGRSVNAIPPLQERELSTARTWTRKVPKYTPKIFEEVGKALAISILDMSSRNPMSRLENSVYGDLDGVRQWLRCYVQDKFRTKGFWQPIRHHSWTAGLDSEGHCKYDHKPSVGNIHLDIPPSGTFLKTHRSSSCASLKGSSWDSDSETIWNDACPSDGTPYKRQTKAVSSVVRILATSAESTLKPTANQKQTITVCLPMPAIGPPKDVRTCSLRSRANLASATRVPSMVTRLRKKRQNVAAEKKVAPESPRQVQLLVQGEICPRETRLPQVDNDRRQNSARRKCQKMGNADPK